MSQLNWYVNIEDSSGNVLGDGPIVNAFGWEYTAALDRAGSFRLSMPATDDKATLITRKVRLRAFAMTGSGWVEVGAGIVDSIVRAPQSDGTVTLEVSGPDLIGEFAYRTVGTLMLAVDGAPVSHAFAVDLLKTRMPDWTLTPDPAPPWDNVYGRFGGDTTLAAVLMIARASRNHFYRASGRNLVYGSTFTPSGITAIRATGDLAPETCAITALSEITDSADLITRIYPRGSGTGDVQLTLETTTRTAPAGYMLSRSSNYIEHNESTATYGRIDRTVGYRDIGPVSNTAADIQAAANSLFDVAIEELRRLVSGDQHYSLTLAGCDTLLRPLQSINVHYVDLPAGLNIQRDLNILEATWAVGPGGMQTTSVVVSTGERGLRNDTNSIADSIQSGQVYQAYPQINANSYVLAFTKNVDQTETANFRFRLGPEVVQLQQVMFDFQILPFESSIKNVGAATVTSGSGGGTTATSTSGLSGNTTIPAGGGTTSAGGSSHSHSITLLDHTHSVSVAEHTHSVTVGSHSHTVPNHQHNIIITGGTVNNTVGFGAAGTAGGLVSGAIGGGSSFNLPTNGASGAVTSDNGGGTTVSSSSGGGSTVTSGGGGGTTTTSASENAHTHSVGNHQHTFSMPHTHDVTIADHTHTVTPTITTTYGIFRDSPANTFALSDLEYSVSGGVWTTMPALTPDADGWYTINITSRLWDPVSFRPLQVNNNVQIRRRSGGATGKGATIDAQLNVRNTIQSTGFGIVTPRGIVD